MAYKFVSMLSAVSILWLPRPCMHTVLTSDKKESHSYSIPRCILVHSFYTFSVCVYIHTSIVVYSRIAPGPIYMQTFEKAQELSLSGHLPLAEIVICIYHCYVSWMLLLGLNSVASNIGHVLDQSKF